MENTETVKQEEVITSDDKVLSLFSHLSILLGGIIIPIIIWAIKKETSKFVRFHSLQSIFYHIAYSVIIGIIAVIFVFIMVATAGLGSRGYYYRHDPGPAFMLPVMLFFGGIILIFAFTGIGYSIYVAIKSYNGEKIKMPILGNIIYEKVYGKE